MEHRSTAAFSLECVFLALSQKLLILKMVGILPWTFISYFTPKDVSLLGQPTFSPECAPAFLNKSVSQKKKKCTGSRANCLGLNLNSALGQVNLGNYLFVFHL